MRRAARWLGVVVAVVLGLPLLSAVLLLAALNTDPGRRAAEQAVERFSGGVVTVTGLSGRFPDALRATRLEVRDPRGPWLTGQDVALDWAPARLLRREARIVRLSAAEVRVARLPASKAEEPSASSGAGFTLPVRVVLDALSIGRLEFAAPVAGVAAALAAGGSGTLESLEEGAANLSLRRVDGGGTYRLDAAVTARSMRATLAAEEPAHGLLSAFAGLPELGALSLSMAAEGPWAGVAGKLALTAGELRLTVDGRVDVPGAALDLDLTASAPAMAPRADVSWQSVQLDAHVHGPWHRPHAQGTVAIERLAAAGATLRKVSATLAGDLGRVSVDATLEGLKIPGPAPDLFAAAPVMLRADARLDDVARPVTFSLKHPLLSAIGAAWTAGETSANAHVDLPDLAPFSALGAPPMQGSAAFDLTATTPRGVPTFSAEGTLAVTGGAAPLPGLLGTDARLSVAATLRGERIEISRLQLDGRSMSVQAHGDVAAAALDLAWQAGFPDLSVLAASVRGHVQASGRVHGAPADLAVESELTGEVATENVPSGPLKISVAAKNLPDAPNGTIHAEGSLDGAPLGLDAAAQRRADGAVQLDIGRADWRSFHADGALTLVQSADLPAGRIALRIERLADFSRLLGQPLGGSLTAELTAEGRQARLRATATNAALSDNAVATATLDVRVRDPLGAQNIDGSLDLGGFRAGGIGGTGRLEANGPPSALALTFRTDLTGIATDSLQATAAARLDAPGRSLTVSAFQAALQGETLRLLAPVRVSFRDGVRLDRARLGLGDAVLDVAGRVAPTLDLTASLRDLPADLLRMVLPETHLAGVLAADASLTGAPARPAGRLHVSATGLRARNGPAAALPAASVVADATFADGAARLEMRATAGANGVNLAGSAPLDPRGPMDLRLTGSLDLAVFDALLAAEGRRARGKATLDATIAGTPADPRANGTLRLANGDFQDVVQGVHIFGVDALVEATGDRLRIAHFFGNSGQGSVAASGTIGLTEAMPVDLAFSGKGATPIATDLLTAKVDFDLALRGDLLGRLALRGGVTVNRADIRVPERLPGKIAVLEIRRPGQAAPQAAPPGPDFGLEVTLHAPEQVFVRGRGLYAELGGSIAVAGSVMAPLPTGSFTLRQGSFNLAGQSLSFSSGEIGFGGRDALDPTLNLVATSNSASVSATLTITGTASAPKFVLSSTPDLPQDEILAQLLFHQGTAGLNAVQLAQAAAALAQITGVGGDFDPLNGIRARLGLDRLAVGSSATGTGATLEAGRYVAPGVFVGAKQGTGGTGSQATVRIDLMRGLKLEATAGIGGTQSATGAAATAQSTGSGIGLSYQFNY